MSEQEAATADMDRLLELIGDAPVRFWSCPTEHPRDPPRVTVVWSKNGVAFCTDCGMTNLTDPRLHNGSASGLAATATSQKHTPFPDDGVTYCGWDGIDGCGEVWPCSTVRASRDSEGGAS